MEALQASALPLGDATETTDYAVKLNTGQSFEGLLGFFKKV
jgi:hypothetical protein